MATTYLEEGKSVAVDNTNADIDVRAHWIRLARELNVPVRCVLFTASAKLAEHNDAVRALGAGAGLDASEGNREGRTMLPKMAFSGFAKRYQEPKEKEGFEDVVRVDFVFKGGEEARRVWGLYWVS